jgi:hypothetical protein
MKKEEKKKEKKCGFCEMRKKMKMKESFSRTGNIEDYLKEMSFAENKPFKVSFNEGISVGFKNAELNEEKSKKLTPKKMKLKKKYSSGMKKNESDFEKRYGKERADEVRSRTAIKMAKKKK